MTYDAVDSSGNHATQVVRTITVSEADPTISNVPDDLTVECQGGGGAPKTFATIANWLGQPTVVDGCNANTSLSNDAPAFFPLGTTTVTWTATDPDAGPARVSRTVTVQDTLAPVITCPATPPPISVESGCTAAIPDLASQASAQDGCSGELTVTQSPAAGTMVGLGGHVVTLTADDGHGNTNTCTVTVTMVDATPPTITACPAGQSASVTENCQAPVPDFITGGGVVASDNCTPTAQLVITQNPAAGTMVGLGGTMVTITVADAAGNTATCNTDFTVTDTAPPVITSCGQDATVIANASCQATVPIMTSDVVASDNCTAQGSLVITQDPPAGSAITGKGPHTITISVKDAANNAATCTKTLTVNDLSPPVITLNGGDQAFQCVQSGQNQYVEPGATVADGCDESVTVVIGGDTPDTRVLGTYHVTYDAVDGSGNQATQVVRTVTVSEPDPTLSGVPNDLVVECQGDGGASAAYTTIATWLAQVTVVDGCDSNATVSNDAPAFFPLGTTAVTWTTSDPNAGPVSATRNLTVQDTLAPTITCPSSPTEITAGNGCTAAIPDVTDQASAADQCSASVTVTQSPPAGTLVGSGDHVVTLTADDGNGHINTCNMTVTVKDTTPPSITACPATRSGTANASCQATVPDFTGDVAATDNCTDAGQLVITQDPAAGSTAGIGTTPVTITVKDAANNAATCSTSFVVTDNTPPAIIICPAAQTIPATSTCQAPTPNLVAETVAADNCGDVTITQSPAAGTLIGPGPVTVTITATDNAGLTDTCTVQVTVQDVNPPTITQCATNQTIVAGAGNQAALPDLTSQVIAGDECGTVIVTQSPAAGTLVDVGDTVVTLTATDEAGLTATCTATVTVQACSVPGDINHDCSVDEADIAALDACLTASNVLYDPEHLPPGCGLTPGTDGKIAADFDKDGDVDQDDFGVIQRCYSGTGKPVDPNCANILVP